MKIYNCRIALGANIGTINPHHEVPRTNVPRAEIVLLRAIHGKDAVIDIKETGITHTKDEAIYQQLADMYPKYVKLVESLFNVKLVDLSSDLDRLSGLDAGLDEETTIEREPEIAAIVQRETTREPLTMD